MITPEVASAIGCKPYGRAIGFRMGGERVTFEYCDDVLLRLGDVAIAHDRVGVFDLKSVLPAGIYRPRTALSRCDHFAIIRSRSNSQWRGSRRRRPAALPSGPEGCGRSPSELAADRPERETAVCIAARAGGRLVWLLLDSGNGDRALVAAHVASMAGLNDSEGEAVVEFDGLGAIRLPMRTRDIIYDGVLGAAFMRDWIFTLDLASNRAWATPAARPKQ